MNSTTVVAVAIDMFTAHERAALAAWWIAQGESFTTGEAAERLNMTRQGAYYVLNGLSRCLPIVQEGGRWRRFDNT